MKRPPDALPPCAGDTDATTHQEGAMEADCIIPQAIPLALLLQRLQEALPPPGVAFALPLSRGLLLAAIERIKEAAR